MYKKPLLYEVVYVRQDFNCDAFYYEKLFSLSISWILRPAPQKPFFSPVADPKLLISIREWKKGEFNFRRCARVAVAAFLHRTEQNYDIK